MIFQIFRIFPIVAPLWLHRLHFKLRVTDPWHPRPLQHTCGLCRLVSCAARTPHPASSLAQDAAPVYRCAYRTRALQSTCAGGGAARHDLAGLELRALPRPQRLDAILRLSTHTQRLKSVLKRLRACVRVCCPVELPPSSDPHDAAAETQRASHRCARSECGREGRTGNSPEQAPDHCYNDYPLKLWRPPRRAQRS